jgi:hypothetical protein
MELSFHQKIALQLGELILEIKKLETINDELTKKISEFQITKNGNIDTENVYSENKV